MQEKLWGAYYLVGALLGTRKKVHILEAITVQL